MKNHFLLLFTATFFNHTCKGFFNDYHSKKSVGDRECLGEKLNPNKEAIPIEKEVFGEINGTPIHQFTIINKNNVKAKVIEFGAILTSLEVPDSSGTIADLTHGFETLDGWVESNSHYFGATIGRFGNRIAHGQFSIGDSSYEIPTNNDPGGIPCSLHGGEKGFNNVIWRGSILNDQTVEFLYNSKDGEEGFPDNLKVKVTYTLNEENELIWEATATTDAPTIVNMVHHSYWNLSGNPKQPILDHILKLNASSYLPTNKGLIPTGDISPVGGTPMDFTEPQIIGERINDDFEPLKLGAGYDHCWVLNDNDEGKVQFAAHVKDPISGRTMKVFTNQPGIQFYTSNFLDGSITGKNNVSYQKRTAFCLETQRFPDSPNQPNFPSCLLVPGETYKHTLVHKFSWD